MFNTLLQDPITHVYMFDIGNHKDVRVHVGRLFAQSNTCKVLISHYKDIASIMSTV
jgi:hypothetical protein